MSIRYGGQPDGPPRRRPPDDARRAGRPADPRTGPAAGSGSTELGMSPDAEEAFARAIRQPYGAVLAVGPTGSGKTTTLYAALDVLNEAERVLMTIEDPVEYQMPGVNQIEVQLQERAHVRARPAHDPALRPRRPARRRDPRRGDGAHRDPGGDDRPPRADDAARAQRRRRRSRASRTWASSRACSRPSVNCIVAQRLARRLCHHCREAVRAQRRGARGARHRSTRTRRRSSTARSAAPRCGGTGYRGPRRAVRGAARPRPDAQAHRVRVDRRDLRRGGRRGDDDAARRTGSGSRSRASRRSTRSAASPATGSPEHSSSLEVADPRAVLLRLGPQRARELVVPVRLVRAAPASRGSGRARSGRSRSTGESSSSLRNSASASSQRRMRKYAMPSASRIDSLSGSRFFAFSSATVACAAMPFCRCALPCWKRLYVASLMSPGTGSSPSPSQPDASSPAFSRSRHPRPRGPAAIARSKATPSSNGGPGRAVEEAERASGPSAHSGALPTGLAGSSSIGFDDEAVDDLDRRALRRLGGRVAAPAHRAGGARADERLCEAHRRRPG